MARQRFYGPVGQVSGGDTEHHYWLEPAPPDDPDKSMQCPQCGRLTWRHTRLCIHCHLDLASWRAKQRLAAMLRPFVAVPRWLARRLTRRRCAP